MQGESARTGEGHGAGNAHPWPLPVSDAWHAVRNGTPAHEAACALWPYYVHRVRTWLTATALPGERAAELAAAHARLFTALTEHPARSRLS
ncbi:hypothetical protein [Streptomyces sp. cg2]|uniref:hypothetical protein n=1 Tax=Streptomyces sp. cg2 TaxID=3238799 RepID=UPI0034E1D24B